MKISKFNLKILSIVLVAVLLSTLLCGAILIAVVNDMLRSQVIRDNSGVMEETARRIETYVQDIQSYGDSIILDKRLQLLLRQCDYLEGYEHFGNLQEIELILSQAVLLREGYIHDLYILRNSGPNILASRELRPTIYSEEDAWYQDFQAGGQIKGFSMEVLELAGGRAGGLVEVIHYVQPLADMESPGTTFGTLVVCLRYEPLRALLDTQNSSYDTLSLVNGTGDEVVQAHTPPDAGEILAILGGQAGPLLRDNRYYFSRPVAATDWVLLGTLPASSIAQQIRGAVLLLAAIVAGCLVLVSCVFLLIIYRTTKPLDTLAAGIRQVSAGALDARLEVNTNDELGEMAGLFNNMVGDVRRLIQEGVAREKRQQELRIKLFMAQINPHFICNTLNAVIYKAQSLGAEEIVTTMRAFVGMLQVTISLDMDDSATVADEVRFIDSYMRVLEFRYGDLAQVEWQVDQAATGLRIGRMLIYPLVENAVFHGIFPGGEVGVIRISIRCEEDVLSVTVEDDGVGMEAEELARLRAALGSEHTHCRREGQEGRPSIGLQNVHERLLLTGGRGGLGIESVPGGGTTVSFRMQSVGMGEE